MNRILEKNNIIRVNNLTYTILDIVGIGSSCVAYLAKSNDGILHLLKEFNPQRYELSREGNGELCLDTTDEELEQSYMDSLERFKNGATKQLAIRNEFKELTNPTSNIQWYGEANGTYYIDMTVFNGEVYSEYREVHIYDLLRRMKTLTTIIGNYHKNGYLHLDIKPANIFMIPETCEMLLLFDFDSVVKKEELQQRGVSYTKNWAAPEQLNPSCFHSIAEHTDIFAIGEILFYQIFGRHSERQERRSFSDYEYERNSAFFKDTDPAVFDLLTELFRKTICVDPKCRYQKAEELLDNLDNAIRTAEPEKPFIGKTLPPIKEYFVGREKEISDLRKLLLENRVVLVYGIGGIGKSELVLNYAKKYYDLYDKIIRIQYIESWSNSIASGDTFVGNLPRSKEEGNENYSIRKLEALKQLATEKTLIIVDNVDDEAFDSENETWLNRLFQIPGVFVMTSRNIIKDYAYYELGPIENKEYLMNLFHHWYAEETDTNDELAIRGIIDYLDSHTLAIELVAKQTLEGFSTPQEKLNKLLASGLDNDKAEVSIRSGECVVRKTPFEYISDIFKLVSLSEREITALFNLTFAPISGIDAKKFIQLCGLPDSNTIRGLINKGWISYVQRKLIKLHPVIAEVVRNNSMPNENSYSVLLNNLQQFINNWQTSSFSERNALDLFTDSFRKWVLATKESVPVEFLLDSYWSDRCSVKYEDLLFQYEKVLQTLLNERGASTEKIAEAYLGLADVYYYKNDYLRMSEYTNKAKNLKIALNRINGWIETNLGLFEAEENINYDSAYKHYMTAKKLFYQDGADKDLLVLYSNISGLQNGFCKFKDALDTCFEALEYCKKKEIPESGNVAEILNQIGCTYDTIGEYEKAIDYESQALEMRKRLFGPNSPETARSYYSLACIYIKMDDILNGQQFLQLTRDVYFSFYGEYSGQMVNFYSVQGGLYDKTGTTDKSLESYKKAVSILKTLNIHNEQLLIAFHNVIATYVEQGQLDDACQELEEAERSYNLFYKNEKCMAYAYILKDKVRLLIKQNNIHEAINACDEAIAYLLGLVDDANPLLKYIKETRQEQLSKIDHNTEIQ